MKMRHGDVVLILMPTGEALPEGCIKKDNLVLAYGEKTGHKHEVDVGELFENREGLLYLKTDVLTKIKHEEHETGEIEKGLYRVIIKRQYNPGGTWRNVQD